MKLALLALALCAACRGSEEGMPIIIVTKSDIVAYREPTPGKTAKTPPRGVVSTDAEMPVREVNPIPPTTRQLITGVIEDWSSTRAQLRLWTRDMGGAWTAAGEPWDAVIGRTGAAWGIGLHGADFQPDPVKREGDGRSPAGAFRINASYGYAAAPPSGTKLAYHQADNLECVDDPKSLRYTQILDGTRGERDWTSSEQMRRDDALYTWVIDIAHNTGHLPGGGSCIFFHVWGGAGSTTVGCTAMPEATLRSLLAALDPAAEPVYVLLTRKWYGELAPSWQLPAL